MFITFSANPSPQSQPILLRNTPLLRNIKTTKFNIASSRVSFGHTQESNGNSSSSSPILDLAHPAHLHQAWGIWEQTLCSSAAPDIYLLSELMHAFAVTGQFDMVIKILKQVSSRNFNITPEIYSVAISCFGKVGQLNLMDETLKKMILHGFNIDSATGDEFITHYSNFGSLQDMEGAYRTMKRNRVLVCAQGVRSIATAYIKKKKFFKLGEFLRDVGLARKDLGNLLWNLMLLSYAANFKMKSLQREFLGMNRSGFRPDINSFNIRALAFSRMSMFWDLHLGIQHMKHENVDPDLVSYGCIVDAYMERRLGRNLRFVLEKMEVDASPRVLTDQLVFEAFGKGDFHMNCEAFMEYKRRRGWSYRELVGVYLKKQSRRDCIFWNY